MRCPVQDKEHAEALIAYCARKLDPETTAVLERHIALCPECRDFAEAQRSVWQALDAWGTIPVSDDFDRRLSQAIEKQEVMTVWSRLREALAPPWAGSFRPAMPLAAACVAVVAVFLMRPIATQESGRLPRVEVSEIEQVERTLEDLEMLQALGPVSGVETERSL